jgi:hypothetical protein
MCIIQSESFYAWNKWPSFELTQGFVTSKHTEIGSQAYPSDAEGKAVRESIFIFIVL